MESKSKFEAVNLPEKKPGRAPLVKNFMLAVVDNELIPYPEAFIEPQYSNQAKLNQDSYTDFLKTNVFVSPKDANNLEKLKEFGSFNCQQTLTTERLFSLEEPEAEKLSYGQFLSNHRTVGEIIHKHCDEQMKQKYLTKMSRGELMGVICLTEKSPPQIENRPFNTYANENDEETFTINGEKSFVLLNELESSLMLVTATVESTDRLGDFEEKIGLFLVEGNTPGVSIAVQHETTGLEEGPFKRVSVKFDKVQVSRSKHYLLLKNLRFINSFIRSLGSLLSDELPSAVNLLNHLRINVGVLAVSGIMRPLINKMSDYFINTRIQHLFYKDLDIMKEYVGKLASTCYALESMIYYTAALKDIYEGQDIDVECAAIKNFAVQVK
jgi:alkylation response protein AidB-like acyl-CoA dehydrogenase